MNVMFSGLRSVAPVGCFPKGKNDCGLEDMSGNVSEWCSNHLGNFVYECRGGGWRLSAKSAECSAWLKLQGSCQNNMTGFRLSTIAKKGISPRI